MRQYRIPLIAIGLCFIIFQFARAVLFFSYHDHFLALESADIFKAFFNGIRFDASAILSVLGLPVFFLLLPFKWSRSQLWQRLWGWVCFLAVVLFVFILAADIIYYDFVSRHVGPEITIATDDLGKTMGEAFGQYYFTIAALVGGVAFASVLWKKQFISLRQENASVLPRLFSACFCLVLMFATARGGFGSDRILIVDAYEGLPPEAANLVLNGPFTALQFLAKIGFADTDYFPFEVALSTTKGLFVSSSEVFNDPEFPMYRSRLLEDGEDRKLNVVIIMLEGWTASSVDAVREEHDLPPIGATPNFDRLCRSGLLLSRYYSSGQRTRFSLCSMVAGLPHLPILPPLGRGLEQNRLPFLGHIANREGFDSFFIHLNQVETEPRYSWAVAATGFNQFLGGGDIESNSEIKRDHHLLEEANRRFSRVEGPFLGFVMMSQPHSPYLLPEEHAERELWLKFPDDSREHRYLNGLGYADWALGRFFDLASKERYYSDTVFFLSSDHPQRKLEGPFIPPDLFHIPGLIISPGLESGVYSEISSQLDIIPTIADLARWKSPYTSFGRSLFDSSNNSPRGAICTLSNTMIRVEEDGWVHHSLRKRITGGKFNDEADLDAIENRLLSVVQSATALYQKNLLCPPEFDPKHPR